MRLRHLLLALPAALAFAAAPASAAEYVPGEVIVKYRDGTSGTVRAEIQRETGTVTEERLPTGSRQLEIRDGESVPETISELRSDPNVVYAVPNFIARASALRPNDPGYRAQWNLGGRFGIGMPDAWTLARRRRAPGGVGAVVAVLDSGVAYRSTRTFRRVPDLNRFVAGYDFVSRDRWPDDLNGHGTHVAGTVAQTTNNRRGAAGIAYRARIMPLRVLDRNGEGTTTAIARALRFAGRRRVDAINMSLEFSSDVRAAHIPDVIHALRYARSRGVTIVAAAGNSGRPGVAYPARAPGVIAVGGTTHRGCRAEYSNTGFDVDVAAPSGGYDARDADNDWDLAHCDPAGGGRWIYQMTYSCDPYVGRRLRPVCLRRFRLPGGYEGTSMSAAHVSGLVALIRSSRVLGRRYPSPDAVERHLESTARDLGPAGFDDRYGHGLIDAERALR